jgi:endonuclease/exonuclease/phosphatase family metal-dependent hydrolase
MLFHQGDAECVVNFIDISAKLIALHSELDVVHFVVAGDFNCQSGSRFYNEVKQCANDLNLHLTIPWFEQKSHRCTVPGWNNYVDEKYSVARSALLD